MKLNNNFCKYKYLALQHLSKYQSRMKYEIRVIHHLVDQILNVITLAEHLLVLVCLITMVLLPFAVPSVLLILNVSVAKPVLKKSAVIPALVLVVLGLSAKYSIICLHAPAYQDMRVIHLATVMKNLQ